VLRRLGLGIGRQFLRAYARRRAAPPVRLPASLGVDWTIPRGLSQAARFWRVNDHLLYGPLANLFPLHPRTLLQGEGNGSRGPAGQADPDASGFWILDPLDGTKDFLAGHRRITPDSPPP